MGSSELLAPQNSHLPSRFDRDTRRNMEIDLMLRSTNTAS